MTQAELEILNRAVWAYGPEAQEIKAVEELAELQQALCKAIAAYRFGTNDAFRRAVAHVYEEAADAEIMLAQIRMIFPEGPEAIDDWRARKIARLKERLEEEGRG